MSKKAANMTKPRRRVCTNYIYQNTRGSISASNEFGNQSPKLRNKGNKAQASPDSPPNPKAGKPCRPKRPQSHGVILPDFMSLCDSEFQIAFDKFHFRRKPPEKVLLRAFRLVVWESSEVVPFASAGA